MHIIAGLGNPEAKYSGNRHNVGFMIVQAAAEQCERGAFQDRFKGRFIKTRLGDRDVALLQPMTFMNRSGQSVGVALSFYKVPLENLIVAHDDLDLPFGICRIKFGGGTAGHKGLQSIVDRCGSDDFIRLRVGIGRPEQGSVEDYVLSDFTAREREKLPDVINTAVAALRHIVERGAQDAMNTYNSRIDGRLPDG